MNMTQVYSSTELKDSKFNVKINFTIIGMILFTLYFSTLKSFLLPTKYGLLVLVFSMMLLFINRLIFINTSIIYTRVDFLWLLFLIILIIRIAINGLITIQYLVDILVYFSGILFLLFVKVNVSYFKHPIRVIKIAGVIYALSAIFQYLFADLYFAYILPLFGKSEQLAIISLFDWGTYSGFTNQTAHLAGYTLSGIGTLIFFKWKNKFSAKVFNSLLLMIYSQVWC